MQISNIKQKNLYFIDSIVESKKKNGHIKEKTELNMNKSKPTIRYSK